MLLFLKMVLVSVPARKRCFISHSTANRYFVYKDLFRMQQLNQLILNTWNPFCLGYTNSRIRDTGRIRSPLCRFFHRSECGSRIQLVPLAPSKWFIHYTQWRYVLRKAGPSWSIFADWGSWRISRTVNDNHTPWIISIYQTTFWCEYCPGYFPTNHGYAAFGYPRHSSLSGRRDYC